MSHHSSPASRNVFTTEPQTTSDYSEQLIPKSQQDSVKTPLSYSNFEHFSTSGYKNVPPNSSAGGNTTMEAINALKTSSELQRAINRADIKNSSTDHANEQITPQLWTAAEGAADFSDEGERSSSSRSIAKPFKEDSATPTDVRKSHTELLSSDLLVPAESLSVVKIESTAESPSLQSHMTSDDSGIIDGVPNVALSSIRVPREQASTGALDIVSESTYVSEEQSDVPATSFKASANRHLSRDTPSGNNDETIPVAPEEAHESSVFTGTHPTKTEDGESDNSEDRGDALVDQEDRGVNQTTQLAEMVKLYHLIIDFLLGSHLYLRRYHFRILWFLLNKMYFRQRKSTYFHVLNLAAISNSHTS